jgi:hypothetical protein
MVQQSEAWKQSGCAKKSQGWIYHDLPATPTTLLSACKSSFSSIANMLPVLACILGYLAFGVNSAPYDPREIDWNLNTNQQTVNPLEYSGEWEGHVYTPSPENWRFPFYTLILDRFVNGDPTNDDINGTTFEHDVTSNQLRYGGDLSGLVESLDYLQGMGVKVSCEILFCAQRKLLTKIKGLYIAGTPFLNLPYKYDAYSVCDFWYTGSTHVLTIVPAYRLHGPRSPPRNHQRMASGGQRNPPARYVRAA